MVGVRGPGPAGSSTLHCPLGEREVKLCKVTDSYIKKKLRKREKRKNRSESKRGGAKIKQKNSLFKKVIGEREE